MKTHLDLFSGIGGFAIAAQWAGFQTIAFCEIEPYAQQVLIEKFGAYPDAESLRKLQQERRKQDFWRWISNVGGEECTQPKHRLKRDGRPMLHSDIFALDGTQYRGVTLLTGGFPCQPFSCAGKRRGKEDDRHLWPEMLRVIAESRPAYVLAENVPGIIQMELDNCLSDLEALGYACRPLVVPACAVDARHRRDRVWVLAVADSKSVGHQGRLQAPSREKGRRTTELGQPSEDVADSEIQQNHGTGQTGLQPITTQCSAVADDGSDNNGRANGTGRGQRQPEEGLSDARGRGGQEDVLREPQCRLGRMADGLPDRVDGCCRWPEEDPQVPRVSKGVRNRTHRLRALGNAIVPQVAYQILKALP